MDRARQHGQVLVRCLPWSSARQLFALVEHQFILPHRVCRVLPNENHPSRALLIIFASRKCTDMSPVTILTVKLSPPDVTCPYRGISEVGTTTTDLAPERWFQDYCLERTNTFSVMPRTGAAPRVHVFLQGTRLSGCEMLSGSLRCNTRSNRRNLRIV
jgi:hypothetical protein